MDYTSFEGGCLKYLAKLDYKDPYKDYYDDSVKYIEGGRGNRIIITISHGAEKDNDSQKEIYGRREGKGVNLNSDVGVKLLGELLAEKIRSITGSRPYVIYFNIHRSKIDANLDQFRSHDCDGTDKCEGCEYWKTWHACIDMAKDVIRKEGSRGLLLDLSANTHEGMLVTLGYGIHKRQGWGEKGPSTSFLKSSSIAKLLETAGREWKGLIIGKKSLGGLMLKYLQRSMEFHEAKVAPSNEQRLPEDGYTHGGYNIRRHGSIGGDTSFDGIQIENPSCVRMHRQLEPDRVFIRRRNAYVAALATAIAEFIKNYK